MECGIGSRPRTTQPSDHLRAAFRLGEPAASTELSRVDSRVAATGLDRVRTERGALRTPIIVSSFRLAARCENSLHGRVDGQ